MNRALAVRPIGTSGSALVGVHPFRTRRNATPVFLLSRSQIVSRLSREQLPFYDYEPAFFRYFASRPDLASNFLRRSRFFSFFFFRFTNSYQLHSNLSKGRVRKKNIHSQKNRTTRLMYFLSIAREAFLFSR